MLSRLNSTGLLGINKPVCAHENPSSVASTEPQFVGQLEEGGDDKDTTILSGLSELETDPLLDFG
jgi:hypothetical protein